MDAVERHTIAVLVDNEAGVLARVIGLFSGRGYNIESLTVAEVDPDEAVSRISIVTSGTPMIIEQIKAQLDRLVPVRQLSDLTIEGHCVERELALVKVRGTGNKRVEALRYCRYISRQGNRQYEQFVRFRDFRFWREIGCLYRLDEAPRIERDFTNRRCCYCTRRQGDLGTPNRL